MKLTKEKLRQIIKEEYQRILSEGEHEGEMDDFEQDALILFFNNLS